METPNSGTRELWGRCSPPLGCGRGGATHPGGPRSTVCTPLTICVPPSPRTLSRGFSFSAEAGPGPQLAPTYPAHGGSPTIICGISPCKPPWQLEYLSTQLHRQQASPPCVLILSFNTPRLEMKLGGRPPAPRRSGQAREGQ